MGLLLLLLIWATAGVLVSGIVLMGVGGKANAKYGNKLMVARVWLQASVLALLALMLAMGHSS